MLLLVLPFLCFRVFFVSNKTVGISELWEVSPMFLASPLFASPNENTKWDFDFSQQAV
jgi:hypothetical protein